MPRHVLQVRRDRNAVSMVTANVLLVAMTVGMAGSMFILVTNLVSPYTPPPVSFLSLQSAGTYASAAPGYCCLNDSFVQVVDVGGDALFWSSSLTFVIVSPSGDILIRGDLEPAPEGDRYLGVFHPGPGFASIPVVGFIDVEPLEEVSAADTVQIYGMSEEYHDAKFQVNSMGRMLSDITLE